MIIKTEEVMKKFEQTGAIQKGHFKLTSGVHSDTYIQCAQVMQYPGFMHNLCSELGRKFRGEDIDVIIGPAIGGIIISHVMAQVLGPWVRAIFTERENGKMTLRRSFEIKKDEKVLVVEDVTTTGGSVREVIDLSLIHISEPTRLGMISYAVFCLKKKKTNLLYDPQLSYL